MDTPRVLIPHDPPTICATYRIRVGRRVGAEWSDRLGMRLEADEREGRAVTTVLTGRLPDQAADGSHAPGTVA